MLKTQQRFSWRWAALAEHRGLSCSSLCPQASRPRLGESLGGDTAGVAKPNWPEGCCVPRNVVLHNKAWAFGLSEVAIAWGLAGHGSAGANSALPAERKEGVC